MNLAIRTVLSTVLVLAFAASPVPAMAETATGVIEGTVTGPDGAPLGPLDTVRVEVRAADSNGTRGLATVDPADGAYRIEDLAAGDYAVQFVYTGSGDLVSRWWGDTYVFADRTIVSLAADSSANASVQLERGTRLTGTVTGAGAPIAGARMDLTSLDGYDRFLVRGGYATSDADGGYATGWVPPGTYTLDVDPKSDGWKTPAPRDIVLGSEARQLDLDLDPWGSISGRVVVRTGDQTAGAQTNINIHIRHAVTGEWTWPGWNHWTASDGTFTIEGLEAREYRLEFESNGAFSSFYGGSIDVEGATSITVGDGEQVTGIDIELASKARLNATVVFRDAPSAEPVPLTGVEGSLWRWDEVEELYYPLGDATSSSSTGAWSSPSLREGSYIVQFRADPYSGVGSEYFTDARYFSESTEITIAAGEKLDLGQIVLEPRFFDVLRVAGKDRFTTSVEISRLLMPEGRAPVVYVTNGHKFPDALAAGPAAIRAGGVILSTAADRLPVVVADELARLDPLRVVILGAENTVSSAVESRIASLVSEDASVERFAGTGRYDTGAMIVRDAFGDDGARYAMIATGENYPDALAAAPAGARYDAPVILVDGGRGLNASTRQLLTDLAVTDVMIAGGPSTVSPGIEERLQEMLGAEHVTRIAGIDRYATAAMINEQLFATSDDVFLATGTGFADALTGAPLAAALGAPLYLSKPACLPAAAVDGMLRRHAAGVWLLGGTPTLGRPVEELTGC